jgi:hypothetical protein
MTGSVIIIIIILRSAVIWISKSALRISESHNHMAEPWLCAVLRTVATRI